MKREKEDEETQRLLELLGGRALYCCSCRRHVLRKPDWPKETVYVICDRCAVFPNMIVFLKKP